MSLTVYTYPNNPRVWKAQIAGKFTGVEVTEVPDFQMGVTNKTKEFLALNPLGKVPTLVTPEGAVWESNAIASYVAHAKPSQLYGNSQYEAALVEQWVHYATNEIDLPAAAWLYPIYGLVAENPEATSKARSDIRGVLKTLDEHLKLRTYLVGERITFADIAVSMSLLPLYKMVLDGGFRKAFTNTNRWFTTLINQPQFSAVIKEFSFAAKMAKAPKVSAPAASSSV
jgi:elongation factor 1-gamma